MPTSINRWRTSVAVVALAFAAACGSDPSAVAPPQAVPKAESKTTKAPSAPGKSVEARADEIIADLKKRQNEQLGMLEKATDADTQRWQQQLALASARLQASQKRLEDARRLVTEAQDDASRQKAALEHSQAQQSVDQDQAAVSRVRAAALKAGVPASALR